MKTSKKVFISIGVIMGVWFFAELCILLLSHTSHEFAVIPPWSWLFLKALPVIALLSTGIFWLVPVDRWEIRWRIAGVAFLLSGIMCGGAATTAQWQGFAASVVLTVVSLLAVVCIYIGAMILIVFFHGRMGHCIDS